MSLKTKGTKVKKVSSKTDQMRDMREKNAKQDGKAAPSSVDKGELIVSDKSKIDILPVLSDEEKAKKAVEDDKRFRSLEDATRRSFVEMMFILRDFKAYGLHVFLLNKQGKKFSSFDSWLKEAAPLSRASGYSALKAAEKLLPLIPKKDLEQMPRYSVELLAKIPKLKLEPSIIKAAQTQTKKDLTKTIQKHAPEAHVETKKTIQIDASSAPIILDAFNAAMVLGPVPENEALEYICASWLDSPCELEQYRGMSNRQAWNAAKQASEASAAASDLNGGGGEAPGQTAA